jgi:hypothetical protein
MLLGKFMNLTLDLTPEEEAKLRAEAQARSTTPESLVRRAVTMILSGVTDEPARRKTVRKLNLPQMRGSVIGSLSRRDIYDERG